MSDVCKSPRVNMFVYTQECLNEMPRVSSKLIKVMFEFNLGYASTLKFLGIVSGLFRSHKTRKINLHSCKWRGYMVYEKKKKKKARLYRNVGNIIAETKM